MSDELTSYHRSAYEQWGGNPKGVPPNPECCAAQTRKLHHVWRPQCKRKRGHGPEGAFCWEHGKVDGRGYVLSD